MRIVIAPSGSRGDFQPLLALAVGLRAAQHGIEAQIRDIGREASPDRRKQDWTMLQGTEIAADHA